MFSARTPNRNKLKKLKPTVDNDMTRKTHVARPWLIKKPMTVTMMLMKLYEISSSIMHPKLRFRFLIEQQTKKKRYEYTDSSRNLNFYYRHFCFLNYLMCTVVEHSPLSKNFLLLNDFFLLSDFRYSSSDLQ